MLNSKMHMNGIPKYLALANHFRTGIKWQKYHAGDLLPNDRSLSLELGCSRPTIQKAFDILEREGLLRKIQGSGVYVENTGNQEETHPGIDIEDLSIVGIANGVSIESHSGKLIEQHIVDTALMYKDGNRKYDPMRICYINDRDLQAKLTYYRNVLGGLIILGTNYDLLSSRVHYVSKQNIPTVFAGLQIPSQLKKISVDTVYVDEFQGGYDAGRYFIERGHTEIGFVHDYHHGKWGRHEGFMKALKVSGLKPLISHSILENLDECQSRPFRFQRRLGAEYIKRMMKDKKRPTAIMCQNDLTAIGAFEELKRMNISMPDEVELFGFADDVESRLFFTNRANPISTVRLPKKTLAEESFKLLVWRMDNPGLQIQIVTLPTTIIHRETTKGNIK